MGYRIYGNFAIIAVNGAESNELQKQKYERIYVSEGTGINKTIVWMECMLCHYWYFKDVAYKFKPLVCTKLHDVLMTSYELKNIAILKVKGVDYRCILWGISKNEAASILNNSTLKNKGVI